MSSTYDAELQKYKSTVPSIAFSQSLVDKVEILNFKCRSCDNEDNVQQIFGSANLRIQKYPADIDLIQMYPAVNEATLFKNFHNKLLSVVREIIKRPLTYLTEAKIGVDDRYYDIVNNIGVLTKGQLKLYNNFWSNCEKLLKKKLLSKKEYKIIKIAFKNNPNQNDYDVVHNMLREKYILRWTGSEILQGYKLLPLNVKFPLIEAIKQNTPLKLDMVVFETDKFMEITNFLILAIGQDGNYTPIYSYFSFDPVEMQVILVSSLQKDIEKLFYSDFYFSPFKALKRMFALARAINDLNTLKLLGSFVSGDISLLYQIKSEMDTDLLLLERAKTPPINKINVHLDNSKIDLSKVSQLDDEFLYALLDNINNVIHTKNAKQKAERMDKLVKVLKGIINFYTIKFFIDNGLKQIPEHYLPHHESYKIVPFGNIIKYLKI